MSDAKHEFFAFLREVTEVRQELKGDLHALELKVAELGDIKEDIRTLRSEQARANEKTATALADLATWRSSTTAYMAGAGALGGILATVAGLVLPYISGGG